MPNVQASIEFLADIPLYEYEKPYLALLPPQEGFDPNEERMDNLEWETHDQLCIADIRGREDDFKLEECGFQVAHHASQVPHFADVRDIIAYRKETEALLGSMLGACHVVCYESRLRKNVPIQQEVLDLNDPFLIEAPARGAHNDVTFLSGPQIIERYLSSQDRERYLKPGYRFRIVNTWRSLLPHIEDRPLALCDYKKIRPEDLIAADRVLPTRVGEVYYLRYNKNQQWYWLDRQRPDEPFVMIMYDTLSGSQARCCPHVSFANPDASTGCPPRQSIETRSIVVSKVQE